MVMSGKQPPLGTSAELLFRYQSGDDEAANAIFARYLDRLTRLARARLSEQLASRTDPEDVVLSAWRSFFVAAREGRYVLRRSGDLWRLLASITMHKLCRQVRHHRAIRRSIGLEESLTQLPLDSQPPNDREPTPEEGIALADELEAIMSQLDPDVRRIFELRLQGESNTAIAADTGRSERTVRRVLAEIREMLVQRLQTESNL